MTPSFMIPPICSNEGGDLPGNHLTSLLEVAEIHDDPPAHLFCYPKAQGFDRFATTWMGAPIGRLTLGKPWRSNLGDERRSVRIIVRPGVEYSGTLYGTYIRARRVKGS